MKKIKFIALGVFALVTIASTVFISCRKEQAIDIKQNIKNSAKYLSSYSPLDFTQINLGTLHNQYVINSYNNLDFSKSTWREDLFNNYSNINFDPTPLGLTHAQFVERLRTFNNQMASFSYDVRNATTSPINENISPFVNQILNECDNITSLEVFNTKLNEIQTNAEHTLYGQDLDIIKASIIVGRSSAYLWAPKSIGGYGLFDQLKMRTKTYNVNVCAKGWRGAVVGDVSASAQYFTGLGIGIAIGWVPGANVVILGSWGIAAAIGSACGALGF